MTEHSTLNKVVVIGGGYAGTVAANRLRMHRGVDIALVNPRPEFVDRVRLHQFVAGTGEAAVDYGSLLGEDVGSCTGLRLRHLRGRQHRCDTVGAWRG
jgi:NADH:ubiquinone reductase (H+-translocating)